MGQYIVEATGEEYEEDAEGFGQGVLGKLQITPAVKAAAKKKLQERSDKAAWEAAVAATVQLRKNFPAAKGKGFNVGPLLTEIKALITKHDLTSHGVKL